jgi:hypothetical protein
MHLIASHMAYRLRVLLQDARFRKLFANVHRARIVRGERDGMQIEICTWDHSLILHVHQTYTNNHHEPENQFTHAIHRCSRAYSNIVQRHVLSSINVDVYSKSYPSHYTYVTPTLLTHQASPAFLYPSAFILPASLARTLPRFVEMSTHSQNTIRVAYPCQTVSLACPCTSRSSPKVTALGLVGRMWRGWMRLTWEL